MFDIEHHNNEVHNIAAQFLKRNKKYINRSIKEIKKQKSLCIIGDQYCDEFANNVINRKNATFDITTCQNNNNVLLVLCIEGDEFVKNVLNQSFSKKIILSCNSCDDELVSDYRFIINTNDNLIYKDVAFFITNAIIYCLDNNIAIS